jgi:PKD repeat protein
LLLAMSAAATTIVMPTDEQLIDKSPVIVEATVKSSEAVERNGAIWTETHLAVTASLKGGASGELVVREIGGELGDRITKIFGAPAYRAGERVLTFLIATPRGDYQTMDLFVGKFTERTTMDGQRFWQRDNDVPQVSLLDASLNDAEPSNVQRLREPFVQFIADRIGGRSGAKNYGIENPVPALDATPANSADFTLLSEPSVYRWGMFDTGGSAKWYSYGAQLGYTSGGVSEVQTAMAAWNGYSQANIHYTYVGTTATHGGNVSPNGVNEVLFEDPNQEIAGAWNPSTGGVVGLGGFNGISGSGNWTAPFVADATHGGGTYRAVNISEGNFVVQDGVSSTAGISSARLAEIAAHEFGHTLGLGHSADSSALMWPSVTGLGASLRADDQLGVRWLYPVAGATTPPPATTPAPPTGLTATATGSTVKLQWIDNATNETGQAIYVAGATGAFTNTANVAANTVTTTLTGFTAGTYRFYVVATNSAGSSAQSNVAQATVASTSTITAAFALTPASGVAGQTTFTFTDQSSGTIATRQWNFGDGTTSTATNPQHVYANAGAYTVTLTVTGGGATSQATRSVSVAAPTAPIVASFAYAPLNPVAGQNVAFTDQSSGTIASWTWNFGDGTTSTLRNPGKSYGQAGTYHVVLTVANGSGATSSSTADIAVSVSIPATPPVSAAFAFAPVSVTVGSSVAFNDQSSGAPTSWLWSFGDGSSSTQQNPSHVFAAAGAYTVTLTASNGSSSAAASRQVVVSADLTYRSLIPVTAQTNGVGGSVWRTELALYNAGNESISVRTIFLPGAGGTIQTRNTFLAPKQLATYNNALLDIFGLSTGAGAIAIEATGVSTTPQLKIASRTFTSGAVGSYGQSVPGVATDGLQQSLYMTGLESDANFRTNVGIVNRAGTDVSATLTLLDSDGRTIGQTNITVAANSFQQSPLSTFFPAVANATYESLSMRILAAAPNAIGAYGSVVDNRTQDPIYLQATPLATGGEQVLPVISRVPGANGTFWRSDVTFFNPGNAFLSLELRYLAAGNDNRAAAPRAISIAPGRTLVLSDVLSWLGMTSGSGALDIRWSGVTAPVVTSRTYTTATAGGTYGQSIDGLPMSAFRRDVYITGLHSDASYRSNVGFVNGSDAALVANVVLVSGGRQVATAFVSVAPRGQMQTSLAALFPNANVSALGTYTLEAHTDGGLFVYGSVVDNASGDPVFFAGE